MTPMTDYGNWNNRVDPRARTVEQTIYEALGDYADEYDIDGIAADWRAAINEALPEGVALAGNEFIGPYHREFVTWDEDLEDEDGRLNIKAVVDGIDFWEIAARHEITN